MPRGKTTVTVTVEQKDKLEEFQDHLESQNGYAPTLGETISIACSTAMGVEA